MLIMPKSCLLHFPKTGGTWAKEAIKRSGILSEEYRINDDPHIGIKHCPYPEKYKIAFVRHPVELYRSYWQYKMGAGWDIRNDLDGTCGSQDFHEFVRKVLYNYPGVCSRAFDDFFGPPGNEIEFIGRYENLVDDLVRALKNAGEIFDETSVRGLPPQNVGNRVLFPAEYTPELERAVKESERVGMERFGYC
ncbi:MAG: hypothetical protein JXL81_12150 [Deltaproteobacteria bacterium]|nr:hypothetical protein [Deltaproteobacteria bacterium]